jgi:hypothetical protein
MKLARARRISSVFRGARIVGGTAVAAAADEPSDEVIRPVASLPLSWVPAQALRTLSRASFAFILYRRAAVFAPSPLVGVPVCLSYRLYWLLGMFSVGGTICDAILPH